MACGSCGGGAPTAERPARYRLTLPSGEVKGPYLTSVEATIAMVAAGGGTVDAWPAGPPASPAA